MLERNYGKIFRKILYYLAYQYLPPFACHEILLHRRKPWRRRRRKKISIKYKIKFYFTTNFKVYLLYISNVDVIRYKFFFDSKHKFMKFWNVGIFLQELYRSHIGHHIFLLQLKFLKSLKMISHFKISKNLVKITNLTIGSHNS